MNIKVNQWVRRIYEEKDFGRNISLSVAGMAALVAYFLVSSQDWIVVAIVALIVFPTVKILASALHSRWINSKKSESSLEKIKEIFDNLSHKEKAVVQAFVWHGAAFIVWGDIDTRLGFSDAGIDSLVHRELVHRTVTSDGMREAFVLNTQLFDYAQTILPQTPF